MTTGLPNVRRLDGAARRPRTARDGWLRSLLHTLLAHARSRRLTASRAPRATDIAPTRTAADVRRGSRTRRAMSARDLHDGAVVRGVIPPRL